MAKPCTSFITSQLKSDRHSRWNTITQIRTLIYLTFSNTLELGDDYGTGNFLLHSFSRSRGLLNPR